jgi:hypothetical protein
LKDLGFLINVRGGGFCIIIEWTDFLSTYSTDFAIIWYLWICGILCLMAQKLFNRLLNPWNSVDLAYYPVGLDIGWDFSFFFVSWINLRISG